MVQESIDLDYKSLYSNLEQKQIKMEEQLREQIEKYGSLIDELIEKMNKLEDVVMQLQAQRTEQPNTTNQTNTNWIVVKERRKQMWERFNQWLGNVPNKDAETIDLELAKFIAYIPKCCDGEYVAKTEQQMKDKLANVLGKPTKTQIPSELFVDCGLNKVLYIQAVYNNLMSLQDKKLIQAYANKYLQMWESKNQQYINTGDWNKCCKRIKMELDQQNNPVFFFVE